LAHRPWAERALIACSSLSDTNTKSFFSIALLKFQNNL
jgi:hypothetical protein